MTEAEKAFEAARKEILRVKEVGENNLEFYGRAHHALDRLPDEIGDLSRVTYIDLDQTQVTDLHPLRPLKQLTRLDLFNTPVSDIAPLADLKDLEKLDLSETEVEDLRPLLDLPELGERAGGLWFSNIPALTHDPELARLSEIEDAAQRAKDTQAYLRTLPPYPEPLPWHTKKTAAAAKPPETPDAQGLPELDLGNDWRIDVREGPATPEDVEDAMKATLWAQLPDALHALSRFGNRYPEIGQPAEAMLAMAGKPLSEDTDILNVHVQTRALQDLRDEDAKKRAVEQMDPDCRAALNTVLRLAPPITLGNPMVSRYDAALQEFEKESVPATVPEGERRVVKSLSEAPDIASERLQDISKVLANSSDIGGAAPARRSVAQRIVLLLGSGALMAIGATAAGAFGELGVELYTAGKSFLIANKDAIVAAAHGWGQAFSTWVQDMLTRLMHLIP